jgi:YVTN family beta-propeller protein
MKKNHGKFGLALTKYFCVAMALLGLACLAAPAAAAPFAYVTDTPSNTVLVIDTAKNSVAATIPAGSRPVGAAITPDGKYVYVVNAGSNNVSVIDSATNKITATVAVGQQDNTLFALINGEGVAITPDGKYAYVSNSGNFANPGNTVSVIATASNTVVATVRVGTTPTGIAITPDGMHAYVANEAGNDIVSVIDTASNTVTATIPHSEFCTSIYCFPNWVAIAPDGKHAYVENIGNGNHGSGVVVIDTASNAAVGQFGTNGGCCTSSIAITPDGKHAYVPFGNTYGGTMGVVFVYDTATGTELGSLPVGRFPGPDDFIVYALTSGVAIAPDGKHAYVTSTTVINANNVIPGYFSVIDTASNTVTANFAISNQPNAVAIRGIG